MKKEKLNENKVNNSRDALTNETIEKFENKSPNLLIHSVGTFGEDPVYIGYDLINKKYFQLIESFIGEITNYQIDFCEFMDDDFISFFQLEAFSCYENSYASEIKNWFTQTQIYELKNYFNK